MNHDMASSQISTTLSILAEIGEAISTGLPLDDVLKRIVNALIRLIPPCDSVSIALLDPDRQTITIRASANGLGNAGASRIGWTCSIRDLPTVQTILATSTVLYIPDTHASPVWRPEVYPENGALAFVGVPLTLQEEVVGLLFVDFFDTDPLTDEARYTVLAFARYAATAIHSAQQQERLRRSEERYRVIASLTSNAIYHWSPDQTHIKWSGDIDALLGYPPGGFPRTDAAWWAAIHPDDRAMTKAAWDAAVQNGSIFESEYRVRRMDGTYVHVLDRAIHVEDTTPQAMIGAISDLTNTYDLTDALINSEVRYRTIFTTALDAIFIIDQDGIIVDANPAAEAMTGREFGKLLNSTISSLAVSGEMDQYVDALHAMHEQSGFRNREMHICRDDGSIVHVEVWGTPLGDHLYQLVAHDISAQQREQALAAQRTAELIALSELTRATTSGGNLLDMLNRALPGAMSVLEIPVGCIYLREGQSQQMRLAAYSGVEDNGALPFAETLPLSAVFRGRATELSGYVRILDSADLVPGQFTALQVPLVSDADIAGLVIFAETRPRIFLAADIRLMDIVGRQLEVGIENVHLLDDLERLVDERTSALFATEMRYKSLIEQVPGIVYTAASPLTDLTFISSGTDDLCGLTPSELIRSKYGLLASVSSDDKQWVRELAATTVARGKDFDAQYRLVNARTLEEHWVHHRARRVLDGTGEAFWLGLLTDVTKLKELDSLKSQFVATVSHELRTPLSAIKLRAATLQIYYERLSDQERLDMVKRISYQADILADLIEDVLRLARLDEGNVERVIEHVNVIGVGIDVVEELQPTASQAGLTVQVVWGDDRCMVAADITDVARIWRNLLSNAIKYTPSPGTVRVFAGYVTLDATQQVVASSLPRDCLIVPAGLAAGKWVAGVVQDTGRGIPESDQPHIFARFYRGEAALTSIPGTGLGLSLVHELLENYEGAITLRSQPGSGSTFVFWLRAIDDEPSSLDQGQRHHESHQDTE